ncbi:MAG: hypothetical protein MUC68_09715 [Burkholderiaceae bacterium]|jgi:hypothetical protein|nr:hypothetical protein [Burkholderiaceae bacterium]
MSFADVFEPRGLWQRVAGLLAQPARAWRALVALALAGAFGTAGAVWIGNRFLSTAWDGELGFVPFADGRIDPFRATFVGLLVAPLLLAAMYLLLGRVYRLQRVASAPLTSFAVAVVGALPVYAAGLTMMFMPAILLVICAFLLSCFWWAAGARSLLGVPEGETAEFNAISILGCIVLMQFAGAALSGLM